MTRVDEPKIAILMATYNGEAFLASQIDSILAQTWQNWDLTISDDGSTDGTVVIAERYRERYPDHIRVVRGPCRGHSANFTSLLAGVDENADYFSWSDQDDVWLPGKLTMAMEMMAPLGQEEPVLYCCATMPADASGKPCGPVSPPSPIPPSFGNALEECSTGGLATVLNRPARNLYLLGAARHEVPGYDWWAYLAVAAAGGRIIFDDRPGVLHRLHGNNLGNRRPGVRWSRTARFKEALAGKHRRLMGMNLAALKELSGYLAPGNLASFKAVMELHGGKIGLLRRLRLAREAGLRRRSRLETAGVYILALLGRI